MDPVVAVRSRPRQLAADLDLPAHVERRDEPSDGLPQQRDDPARRHERRDALRRLWVVEVRGRDLATYLRTQDASVLYRQRNSQLANSNVLIWSMGNAPMVLQLSFPEVGAFGGAEKRSTYVVHPLFSFPCRFGTLFVFSPIDDLFFCHEAFFDPATLSRFGATGYRLAFVLRWLSPITCAKHMFFADGVRKGQMKPSEEEVRNEEARVKQNRRTRRKKRGLE